MLSLGMFLAIAKEDDEEEVSRIEKRAWEVPYTVQNIFTQGFQMIRNQKQWNSIESQKQQENRSKWIEITFERYVVLQKYYISPYKQLFKKYVGKHSPITLQKPKNR